MRILIVENFKSSELGQVGVALEEAGSELEFVKPFIGEALPESPDSYDGIVVFGGEQSAIDDHTHPYLPDLARLMRCFGEADKSVLGICLGSQVLARAYGGENLLGKAHEFGWKQIELTEEGAKDPVLEKVGATFSTFQWHGDTFTLPEQAARLASNVATPNQCFRIGRASYGMQLHFEASQKVVEGWNAGFADTMERLSPGWSAGYKHLAETYGPSADATGLAIARAWVATVNAGSVARSVQRAANVMS
jgi:GMP synthase (glutamine-hydrolysing)